MDSVLKPELVWVNGGCYRKNPLKIPFDDEPEGGIGDTQDLYDTPHDGFGDDFEEYAGGNHVLEELNGGRYKAGVKVASAFFPMLVGKKGATKKRIESETRTRINIPRQGVETEDVTVVGYSKKDVLSACNRIDLIVASSRTRMGFTHFISIPLNTPGMQEAFEDFKSKVLETLSDEPYSIRKIDESVFQTPSLLHLTVGVLALMDQAERQQAMDLLQDCKETVIMPLLSSGSLKVKVEGLEIMNDDPAEVDVVYAKVQNQTLQQMADQIVEKFCGAGMMKKQYERVKLHMTLLNTTFRKPNEEVLEDKNAKKETFDARRIMVEFGDRFFGEVDIQELHLSQRRAGRRTEANYYYPSTIVSLNSCG